MGSRRARQLCKRLAVAGYEPVLRDELIELLWPDEPDLTRVGPRLSVLLSNIRRVLGGGLIADRAAVRLDPAVVRTDLQELYRALREGDDATAVACYHGPVLPEDAYDDWATLARDRLSMTMVGAHRRLASTACTAGRHDAIADHALAILALDPYDELAHEQLIHALVATGRHGEAVRADERYRAKMTELGFTPRPLLTSPTAHVARRSMPPARSTR